MNKKRIDGIKLNKNTSAKILTHKNFAPLDEEIIENQQKSRKNKPLKIIFIGIIVLAALVYFGHLLSKAVISIEKAQVSFTFSNDLVLANQSSQSYLPFTVVEVTDTYHEQVVPDVLNSKAEKARGSIIIYNNGYSKSKISLRKGTVFIANNNIRFVSDTAVTLPGYTLDDAKQIVPGQVIVKITAEKVGSSSNIGNADLTLSNYQKSKTKIYARTNEPISGGADQMAFGLSEDLKKTISDKIDQDLKKSLFIKAGAEIPGEYVLYLDMFTFTPKSLVISGTPQSLDVSKEASLIAYVFKRKDIETVIQKRLNLELPQNPQFLGIEDLDVKIVTLPKDLKNPESLELNFSGNGQVVSYINTSDLIKQVKNKKVSEVKNLLSSNPGIQSFNVKIIPGFMWVMPKVSNRIKIVDIKNN